MRILENYINSIHRWENPVGENHNIKWSFFGDGQGDFEQISDVVPNEKLLKEYLKYLRNQASYVSELLKKSA